MIDEIDTLIGDTLIAVLRQLRARYDRRPGGFPQSVVLCGVRDVRDYRIRSSAENTAIAGGNAFNVRAESHDCRRPGADSGLHGSLRGPDGHLVVFDRRADRSWDEKIFRRAVDRDGRTITVWGM